MSIRLYKSYTPGTRNRALSGFAELTKSKPEKSLIKKNKCSNQKQTKPRKKREFMPLFHFLSFSNFLELFGQLGRMRKSKFKKTENGANDWWPRFKHSSEPENATSFFTLRWNFYFVKNTSIHKLKKHWSSGIGSFNKQHLLDHKSKRFKIEEEDIDKVSIETIRFKDLVEKYQIKQFYG